MTLLALLALFPMAHSAGYAVGYATQNAVGTGTSTSLSVSGAYATNFFAIAGMSQGGTITPTNAIANVIVDRSSVVVTTSGVNRYLNISAVGHGTAATGTITYNTCGGSGGCDTAIAGVGANVIYTSNTLNGNFYRISGTTEDSTTYSLSFPVAASNSFVIILYSAGGQTWNSAPTTSAAGCPLAQDAKQGTFAEASVRVCGSVSAGTYTANVVTRSDGTGHGTYVIAAYVFPPYAVTLNDNPTAAGNVLTQGTSYQSGNTIQIIGTNSIQSVPNTGYTFTSWSASAPANLLVANTLSSPTPLTVEGAGTITANYKSTLSGITLTPSAAVLDSGQTEVFTGGLAGGVSPYTYNYFNVTGGTTLARHTGVAGTSDTYSFTVNSLTQNHAFTYNLMVTDSFPFTLNSISNTIIVNAQLAAPAAPTIAFSPIDLDQAETINGMMPSGGTSPYTYSWMVSYNGGGYAAATQCAVNSGTGQAAGNAVTCSVAANTFLEGSYEFKLQVTDGASATVTSAASPLLSVGSALTAPNAPTVSAQYVDSNQVETVSGMMPSTGNSPFAYNWLVSDNGGAYAAATQCAVNSGTGQISGSGVTCAISGGVLVAGHTYLFELKVTDSAAAPESATSTASGSAIVSSQLTAPAAATLALSALDLDQAETINGMMPSTGTSPYTYSWLVSYNGGGYVAATQCAVNSLAGQVAGSTATCSVPANAFPAGAYNFELQVTDGASATVASAASSTLNVRSQLTAPAAPTLSSNAIDTTQPITITSSIPFSGTAPYDYSWLVSIDGAPYGVTTRCDTNSGTGQPANTLESCFVPGNTLSAGDTYALELQVTDSASLPEIATSASNTFTVSQTATPSKPAISDTKLDVDDGLVVTGVIPSSGASPYSYDWLVSTNSLAFVPTTQCAANSGTGQAANAIENCVISGNALAVGATYSFELQVTDHNAVTTNSEPSDTVAVASQLTAPVAPVVSAPLLDNDQVETINGIIPSTGTSPYSYTWLRSVNGGSYATATECNQSSGSGQPVGNVVTCTIEPGNALPAGQSPNFELQVRDGSTTPEGVISAASENILVSEALTAPDVPAVAYSQISYDEAETVNGVMPSTGTAPYAYTWLISDNGGAYALATQCAVSSDTGQYPGNPVECDIPANTLTSGHTYLFELAVTDGATFAESATSTASSSIIVTSPLPAPSAPALSSASITVDASVAVTDTLPPMGAAQFNYGWLISEDGGAFVAATQCAANSGTGQAGSAVVCSIPGYALASGHTYGFELQVSNSLATLEAATSAASSMLGVNAVPPASQLLNIGGNSGGGVVGATTTIPAGPGSTAAAAIRLVVSVDNGIVVINNYTSGTPVTIDLHNPRISFSTYLPRSANVSVVNVTNGNALPPLPPDFLGLLAYNVTMVNAGTEMASNATLNTTLGYNCSVPSQSIRPLILANGTWLSITPFAVNASGCTVSFQLRSDPVIALAEYAVATATTTASTTTTVPQPAAAPNAQAYCAVAILAIALLLAILLLIARKRRAKEGRKR